MSESVLKRAAKRAGAVALLTELSPEELIAAQYAWELNARPEQITPKLSQAALPWLVWLLLAGRGFGKSRTGAEFARAEAHAQPGSHGALIAPTAADARDVMVKALLDCSPPWEGLDYEPSKRRLTWRNGSTATLYSAEEPDRLRGPQHHWAWADEIAAWPYLEEVWDMLMFTLRLGAHPRVCASTTPRPLAHIRKLLKDDATAVTRGSTFDNAENLSPSFLKAVSERYEGTRLGRQELYAELLDDVEGALWTHALIERARVVRPPQLQRVVIAVDPSGSAKKTADEAGIVAVGVGQCACLGRVEPHVFVLEDASGRYSPRDMAEKAIALLRKWNADRIVAEDNFGGKIIEDLLRLVDPSVPYRAVHASRGKIVRAEPVAALYEQGKAHHVGLHRELEDEMCSYAPLVSTESPGRLDANVWGITDLMLGEFIGDPGRVTSEGHSRYSRRDGI